MHADAIRYNRFYAPWVDPLPPQRGMNRRQIPATHTFGRTLIVASMLLPSWIVRIALLVDESISITPGDTVGFLSDAAVALLLAAALMWLASVTRRGRLIGMPLVAIWSLINFANFEHIKELGSIVSLDYAGYLVDVPFLRGSALAPTHPLLLALTIISALGLIFAAFSSSRATGARACAVVGAVLLALTNLIPRTGELARWRQTDVLSAQAAKLIHTSRFGSSEPLAAGFERLDARDLEGAPLIAANPRARNVLVVILEGVSGAYLPSFNQHETDFSVTMPKLDEVAREGLAYSRFIATQRQTNRGEYALLCGDYPKLVTGEAKMAELVGRRPLKCLPSALQAAGYSTVYLQAAPMAFMMKDQFMPQAGFEQVFGDATIERSYNRNHWGVDDRAFLEHGLEMIEQLDSRDKPWFLTLLTVGTHHRYNVPPDFSGIAEPGTAAWAFEYLDDAIGDFVLELRSRGILDTTLVLITSDESQATIAGAPDDQNLLAQAWGFLIALTPSREQGSINEVFVQPDLPISVLDYLQIESTASGFAGRSIFRAYDHGRGVFWGNTYLGLLAGFTQDGRLTICSEDFDSCESFATTDGDPFSPSGAASPAAGHDVAWLQDAARRSLATIDRRSLEQRSFALIAPGRYPVESGPSERYIFGGQFVTIPAHSRADVDIVVTVRGDSGWVDITHNYLVDRKPELALSNRVKVGETLKLRYTIETESPNDDVECRFWVMGTSGRNLELDFETAQMRIAPVEPGTVAPGIEQREYSVSPAG